MASPPLEASHAPRWLVPALLGLALLVRLAYLAEFRTSPLFEGLALDELNYDKWAQAIAGGDILGKGPFTANPLGPYVLGLIYAIMGRDLLLLRLVQALADTATCYFMYRVADQLLGGRAARLALCLAALYGPAIFFAANLVAEVWVMFFVSLSLFFLTHPRWAPWRRILAGGLFATAVTGRPNLLLMAPLLPFSFGLSYIQDAAVRVALQRYGWFRALFLLPEKPYRRRAFLWFIGMFTVLGLVFARNAHIGGDKVLVTAHGGVNLWIGNNPDADGFFKTPRGSQLAGDQLGLVESSIKVAERGLKRAPGSLKPSEASDWWKSRAYRFMAENPGPFLALTLKKTALFFNAYEKPLETNYHFAKTRSGVLSWLTLGFGLVSPLSLLGMWLARGRWRKVAVLYVYSAVYAATVIFFFISMRYRLPVILGIMPFAGLGLSWLIDAARGVLAAWRQPAPGKGPRDALRPLMPTLAVLAGATLFTFLPLTEANAVEHDLAHTHFLMGNLLQDKEKHAEALVEFETAVKLYPEWGGYYNNLGLAYVRNQQPEKALEVLQKAVSLDRADRSVYRNMAKAWLALGKLPQAEEAYRKALKLSPRHAATYQDLGLLLERQGRLEEARQSLEQALRLAKEGKKAEVQALLDRLGQGGAGVSAPTSGLEGEAAE